MQHSGNARVAHQEGAEETQPADAASTLSGFRVHAWGGPLVREEWPRAEPGPGELRVDVEACGVGRTVLNCIAGDLADGRARLPRVPGHELVGRVARVGPGVDPTRIGERVVAYFYRFCGRCHECADGRQSRCAALDGFVGVHSDGGYAPSAVLPARNAVPVPDGLDPVAATVVPDAVATPVHVCEQRARVTAGDRVVVIGAGGGVGVHLVQVALLHGARVVGLDVGDEKLAAVERLGAVARDSTRFDAVDPAALWPDGPPHVVVDLLGSDDSLPWSAAALGTGGRLVVLTTFPGQALAVEPRELVFREASLVGSRYASVAEVTTAARLVASGRVTPVVGEVVGPDGIAGLHEGLRDGLLVGRGALVW
ncbi:MAG: alcohol dehydrogenase catalytic domain-containing protein [Actinomycetes bacterium]